MRGVRRNASTAVPSPWRDRSDPPIAEPYSTSPL
jgi:hypothetical protein